LFFRPDPDGPDRLELDTPFHPRFVRRYAQLGESMREAFQRCAGDVKSGDCPSEDQSD